ncbi:MAG: diguanylate cyclase [Bacteroidales bacterium]|nr:diguanylate cyclase [Bacteroidales bacterium]
MEKWSDELPFVAITICDKEGKIIDMNRRSIATYEKDGGKALIGKQLMDCHPERAKKIITQLMSEGKTNAYTIEKEGLRKLIYQSPWYENGEFAGLVEMSVVLPETMPHYVRTPKKD